MSEAANPAENTPNRMRALVLGAIGVVYGDIGTSPLYTIKQTFGPHGVAVSTANVYGVLSLIFWSLILVVSIKYAGFIMRADNKGEGGIMALTALAQRSVRSSQRARWWIVMLGLFGTALFFGDGVITPAISVLGAIEGLEVIAPQLDHWVVPISAIIIVLLFLFQKRGTGRVGAVFAPVMIVWFMTIAALGLWHIALNPEVLRALSPHYAIAFFAHQKLTAFFALGSVILAITGAEALYADMGHFGKKPIRRSWFAFVLPALVLNYFGQGALLISDPSAVANPLYRLVPSMMQLPLLILATAAAVIASQAVISGAFSITREAIQLGFLPRMQVKHTSVEQQGQVYLPWINRTLMVLTLAVVVGFRSSDNLGAAYGIAVVGTMTIDSILVMIVFRRMWHWPRAKVVAIGVGFLLVDTAFLAANADKVEHGGWFPLALGAVCFTLMATWRRGRELVTHEVRQGGLALEPFIDSIAAHPPLRVPGSAVFLTANQTGVPNALLHNLKHNKVLHERNVIMKVETVDTPTADADERMTSEDIGGGFYKLTVRFGFAEDPDVPRLLLTVKECGLPFDLMDTTFFLSRESIVATDRPGMAPWRDGIFAFMQRNAIPATAFFQIPGNRLIELGTQVEI